MKQTENNNASVSLSKQRKLERAQALKKQKKDAAVGKLIGILVSFVLIAGIIALFGAGIFRMITKVNPDSGYSAQLNADGTIHNITIPYADIAYTDEQINKDIDTLLKNNAELSKDSAVVAKDGDKVNIDYVGTVDGVAFAGGKDSGVCLNLCYDYAKDR